jgi:glycosyltransferase involved in cell wall biosynthesis
MNTASPTPLVSVIIPVYNVEKYLSQCLDSIVNQTLKDIEIICINDASTDDSLAILQEYARRDDRFIIINNETNVGAPGAVKNEGLKQASGEYIGFVDSDDWIDENYFLILYNNAVAYDCDISASTKIIIHKNDKTYSSPCRETKKLLVTSNERRVFIKTFGTNCSKIYRRNFIRANGIFCWPKLNIAEDNYFSCLSEVSANKIITTKKVAYHYRRRKHSITANARSIKDFGILDVYQAIDHWVAEHHKEYLPIIEEREIQDFTWFLHDCIEEDRDSFRTKLRERFSHLLIFSHPLIVSLTSYPARIGTVNQTIESILNQTLRADKIILWLAPEQFPNREKDLPKQLLALCGKGLTIDWYHDIKPYKKLIPSLRKYPNAVIVTADDDNIYSPSWLQKLYESYLKYPCDVQAHRITKFYHNNFFYTVAGGKDYYKDGAFLNKLTGVGGVLYPPHCFYKDILDEELFTKLAPTNDDQWFWCQSVLNDVKIRVVENSETTIHYVPGTQETGLTNINDHGEKLFWKDFRRLINHYPDFKKKLLDEARLRKEKHNLRTPYRTELENWWQRIMGTELDLDNPRTLNEKIQWLKLYDSTPIKTRLADKYLVRDWVKEKVGEQYLIPLLGVYNKFDDIKFDQLPNQFVIKCNHGCGYNIIVKEKGDLNLAEAKEKVDRWMETNFAFHNGYELHYRDIQSKIIIEKYIENKSYEGETDLYDYKFWCFGGKVSYIQFISERSSGNYKMAFYTPKWEKQSFVHSHHPLDERTLPRPKNLTEMIQLAEKLSSGFSLVRVDFYRLDDGTLYFGEMTFSPASGTFIWEDEKYNLLLGKKIQLTDKAYNIDTGEYYKLPKVSKVKKFFYKKTTGLDGKVKKRYLCGLLKKVKSPKSKKVYFCGIQIYHKKH